MASVLAYLIHLRNDIILLSKVRYSNWQAIQDDYVHYVTSLGPWDLDSIIDHFTIEYGVEGSWAFSKDDIQDFLNSDEHILCEKSTRFLDLDGISPLVLQFNRYINARDLDGLASLMTDDHIFIDSANDVHEGKESMIAGWTEFFQSYPDYQNIFEAVYFRGESVIMRGYSTCSFEPLDGPAIWSAKVRDGLLSEWRVYLDTEANRSRLEIT